MKQNSYPTLSILFVSVILLFTADYCLAQDFEMPANKIGASYWEIRGSRLGLSNITGGASNNDTDYIIGNVYFIERVIYDVFAIGAKYGSGLTRQLDFKVGSDKIEVEETVSFSSVNLIVYTSNHMKDGMKGYLQVGYGSLQIESSITTNSSSADTTSAAIPIKTWAVGFDYILGWFGTRLEAGMMNGHRTDLENGSTYYADYKFNSPTASAALYFLF